jgi:hypothetical protein
MAATRRKHMSDYFLIKSNFGRFVDFSIFKLRAIKSPPKRAVSQEFCSGFSTLAKKDHSEASDH